MPAADVLRYEALPSRVVFGDGAIGELPAELERLQARHAILIDGLLDPRVAEEAGRTLGTAHAATLSDVRQHVPADLVASSLTLLEATDADALVALGGGSAIGLAKALARSTRLPIVAIPTTYAGSEMTPIWGLTEDGRKTTGRDLVVLPATVVYDPELTLSLPPGVSAASGMNAIAHCVEALWTVDANPMTDAVASDGIAVLAQALRDIVARPHDLEARGRALRGAWLGGSALAVAGTALHHKICHVLGGTFDLPHAEVHAAVLPWVVDHFREAAPLALERVARTLAVTDAAQGLIALAGDLGLAIGLSDLGLSSAQADEAAALVVEVAPSWPAPVTRDDVRSILDRAMAFPAHPKLRHV